MPKEMPKRHRTKQGRCPICGEPSSPDHAPFCSRRCADIDLGRWLKGHYAIPTEEGPAPDQGEDEEV